MSKLTRTFIDNANHDASVRAHHMGFGARSFLSRAWQMESRSAGGGHIGLQHMKRDRGMAPRHG